ncbi:oxytocin-neurophysin 1-like [Engraulis encrasicolus]|uniref:oxytocin-neurophysin 1-like n=1 Tax=Engraulis encrasicolus TaxID=184585 RepID=UPI002FD46B39
MNDLCVPLLCLLGLLSVCSACYIQNCPRGGKRSFPDQPPRQCMSCGPGDRGRCFGPAICCGEELGCWVGSPEASRCGEEEYLPSPCEAGGKPCGATEDGRCAAPGICCDTESCALDAECQDSDSRAPPPRPLAELSPALMAPSPAEFLLRLLQHSGRPRSQF